MATYKTTTEQLTSIANAIREKGGTNENLTYPAGFVSAIQNISTVAAEEEPNVRYLDYDGTVIATYTKAEFAQLQAHPANPTHSGLIAQGWNWTLADAQAYVASYNYCDIGQVYITDDGKNKIYLTVTNTNEPIEFYSNGVTNTTMIIDWGDGSAIEEYLMNTAYTYFSHTFNNTGNYIISISNTSSEANFSLYLQESIRYYNYITEIHWGNYGKPQLNECCELQYLTIPNNANLLYSTFAYTKNLKIFICPNVALNTSSTIFRNSGIKDISYSKMSKNYQLSQCYNIKRIIIPEDGVTTKIPSNSYSWCRSLTKIIIPNTITEIESSAFTSCCLLESIKLPNALTKLGSSVFSSCVSLSSINLPNTLTSIGQGCFAQTSLGNITLPNLITTVPISLFSNNYLRTEFILPSGMTTIPNSYMSNTGIFKLILPEGITEIGTSSFQGCSSLTRIILPESLTTIGASAFTSTNIFQLIIPSKVSSIGVSAFAYCNILNKIYLKSTTPPTLTNANTFQSLPNSAIFYVPKGYLETYQTADIWSTWASKMVEEE